MILPSNRSSSSTQEIALDAALCTAAQRLHDAGIGPARLEAQRLAAHLLGISLGELQVAALMGHPAPQGFEDIVARRAQRIPLQYLTGYAAFRYLDLAVGPGVFIPRPETELVTALAIERGKLGPAPVTVVDLATGSGAIAAACASEIAQARVYAVDISEEACSWARKNFSVLHLDILLECGDLRTAYPELEGSVDMVISNPPYIPAEQVPQDPEVSIHEPDIALYGGGVDGMELPDAVIRRASELLRPGGYFIMEHDMSQGDRVHRTCKSAGFESIVLQNDLTGRPRATSAILGDAKVADCREITEG